MCLWSSREIEFITKTILYLLRDKFMRAKDFDQMRHVFLEEPCKLLTIQIQTAYVHLANNGNEEEIPEIKNTPTTTYTPTGYEPHKTESYTKYMGYDDYAASENPESFSLRYNHVTLVLPQKVDNFA